MRPEPGRALDLKLVAVEVVVALQRLDQQKVDREPDRPAPVGVAAEQAGVRFAGHVVHPIRLAHDVETDRDGRGEPGDTERMPCGERNSFSSSR